MKLVTIHAGAPQFKTLEWAPSVDQAPQWRLDQCNAGHHETVAKLAQLDREAERFLSVASAFGLMLLKSSTPGCLRYNGPPLRAAIHTAEAPTHHWTMLRVAGRFRAVQSFGGLFTLEEGLAGSRWLSAEAATQFFGVPFAAEAGEAVNDMALLAVHDLPLGGFLGALEQLLGLMASVAQDQEPTPRKRRRAAAQPQ